MYNCLLLFFDTIYFLRKKIFFYPKHTDCCLKLPVIAYFLTLLDAQMLEVTVTLAGDFQYVELSLIISLKLGAACYVFLVAR